MGCILYTKFAKGALLKGKSLLQYQFYEVFPSGVFVNK